VPSHAEMDVKKNKLNYKKKKYTKPGDNQSAIFLKANIINLFRMARLVDKFYLLFDIPKAPRRIKTVKLKIIELLLKKFKINRLTKWYQGIFLKDENPHG
jgi:hypothetical protein